MSAWIYIMAGAVVFIVCLSALVIMTVSDDWERVDGEVNHSER